jgi:hypothetical protein
MMVWEDPDRKGTVERSVMLESEVAVTFAADRYASMAGRTV